MESTDLAFIQKFKSPVFIYGKNDLTSSLNDSIKKIATSKDSDWSNFNFQVADTLAIPFKKNKISNSKTAVEGILRSNWLKKRLELIPSTVLFVSDFREIGPGRESPFFNEYSKYMNNLRSRHITSIFLFLVNKNQQAFFEEQMGFYKRVLDTDSKNIFFVGGGFDTNLPQLKKLDKLLQESSKNHYNELLKRHKSRTSKSGDITAVHEFNLRVYLKIAILYEFMQKYDKSQAQLDLAYQTIVLNLLQAQQFKVNTASKSIPDIYLAANYEAIHRLEELRHLADLIKIRLFYQFAQKNELTTAHTLLYAHINLFKDKIEYIDPRFRFEEYKWRARLFHFVCLTLLNVLENNPRMDINYITSRIIAFCDSNNKRKELFLQNNADLAKSQDLSVPIALDTSYVGFDRYKHHDNDAIEIPKQTDTTFINDIIRYRLITELKQNVHIICIEMLTRLLKNIKQKDGTIFLIEYALAQQYYLNGDKQRFMETIPHLLTLLEKNNWAFMIKDILHKNENFLLQNKEWEGLVTNCLKFFLQNQIVPERQKILQEATANLTQPGNFEFNVADQSLFKVAINFEPTVIKYLHDFHCSVAVTIPEVLKEFIEEIELKFNDQKYLFKEQVSNFKQEEGNRYILNFSMSATHLVQNNRLFITEIKFNGKNKSSNGSESNFSFSIKENAFLSNQDNILLLQLVDDLHLKIESNQPGYINEKVDVLLKLCKKDKETKIKYVSVYLYVYERGRIHDIIPGFFPRDITMYHITGEGNSVEMNKDNSLNMLEFADDSQEMLLNFAVKATVDGRVTFVFKVKYDVIKMENGKMIEIPKELTEHFTSRTLAPFMHYLNWKTNLKEINHVRDTKTIIYRHPLPLNNTSCLNITFSPIYHDVIVQAMKINLNRNPQISILREPASIESLVLLKNQLYTSHLLLKPTEEIEDLALGDLEIFFQRKEHEANPKKDPIVINISLENICVYKRSFTVLVNVETSCVVGTPTSYNVTIMNNTSNLHKIEFMVLANESFLFSGHSKYIIDILPRSSKEIKLQMIPIEIGRHKAPVCLAKCLTLENEVLLDTEETRIIYVYPQKQEALL